MNSQATSRPSNGENEETSRPNPSYDTPQFDRRSRPGRILPITPVNPSHQQQSLILPITPVNPAPQISNLGSIIVTDTGLFIRRRPGHCNEFDLYSNPTYDQLYNQESDLTLAEAPQQFLHHGFTEKENGKVCCKPAGLETIYKLKGTISEKYLTESYKERKIYPGQYPGSCKERKKYPGQEFRAQPVSIIVNHFPVIQDKRTHTRIYHYEVKLNPSSASKALPKASSASKKSNPFSFSKALTRRLKYLMQEEYFNGDLIAYDDGKNMFIAESTLKKKQEYLDRDKIQFNIKPWEGATTSYEMKLKRVNVLSDSGSKEFLKGSLPNCPPYYLHALQAALRDGPSSLPYAVNKTSYYLSDQLPASSWSSNDDCDSIQPMTGFVKSLCAVERGLTLNLDSTSTFFHVRSCVAHYLKGRGIAPRELLLKRELMGQAKGILVDLYVDIVNLATDRKFRIAGILEDSAEERELPNEAGGSNVVEYFKKTYAIDVEPHFPCLIVKGKGKNAEPDLACLIMGGEVENSDDASHSYVLPMEACIVAKGQKFGKASRDGGDAQGRYQMIRNNFKFVSQLFHEGLQIDDQKFPSIKPFGISIADDMISVVSRLIPEPKLVPETLLANESKPDPANAANESEPDTATAANGSERDAAIAAKEEKRKLSRGEWKLKKVFKPGRSLEASQWDAIVFNNTGRVSEDASTMVSEILRTCSKMSINCFGDQADQWRNYDLCVQTSDSQSSDELETAFRSMTKKHTARLAKICFVFCIFHKNLKRPLYEAVKRICETESGWITQCCVMERLNLRENRIRTRGSREGPPNFVYYEKVALKVNAKLGGVNNALYENKFKFLRSLFGSKNPVILFGANVTHLLKNQNNNDNSEAERQGSSAVKSRGLILLTMVASMEWPIPGQYCARVSLLPPKAKTADIAYRFSAMAKELLHLHIEKNQGIIPTRAIFFREGVSESEFQSVVDIEFRNLKHALQSIFLGIKSSFIVTHRNQNTRFFLKTRGEDGKEVIQNPEAGTVVDNGITRHNVAPQLADFYLLSQSIQRGSLERPTHYFLLDDDNGLSTNLERLEKFVFYLCYTYATSTFSVAVVPPLLYAREAASHARASYVGGKDSDQIPDIQPHANLVNTMYFC